MRKRDRQGARVMKRERLGARVMKRERQGARVMKRERQGARVMKRERQGVCLRLTEAWSIVAMVITRPVLTQSHHAPPDVSSQSADRFRRAE